MTHARAPLWLLASLLSLTPAACGEEAVPGDDSDTDSGDGNAGDALIPLVDGFAWTYAIQNADHVTTNTRALALTAGDEPDTFLLTENEDDETLVREGTRTLRIHEVERTGIVVDALVDYEPGFVRADEEWASAAAGDTFDYDFTQTTTDANGDDPVVEERSHRFTVIATSEEVVTQAGTFETVHVGRETLTGDQVGNTVEYWYAPGTGLVQVHQLAWANADPDLAIDEEWEVLLALTVPEGED